MNGLSDFLFARPSFLEGAGRALDLGDTLTEYNRSFSGVQADWCALFSDWRMIGQDLKNVIQARRAEIEQGEKSVETKAPQAQR